IELCQPLRHPVVIGILRFKGELLVPMQEPIETAKWSRGEAAIRRHLSQRRIAISNESNRWLIMQHACRRLISKCNQIVIKIRSSIRDLRSFYGKFARHVPRRLLKRSERKPVTLKLVSIGLTRVP